MYTKAEWDKYTEMYDELETFAYQYVREFGAKGEDVTSVSIDDGMIDISTEEFWSYGGHDYNSHYMPVEYLCDENWLENEKARLEAKRIEKEKADNQEKINKRNAEIAEEKARYLELQKKYGGSNEI